VVCRLELSDKPANQDRISSTSPRSMLPAATRLRLGQQLRNLYTPLLEEPQSARIAELLEQLDTAKPREA
jgi:hypothetical protein